MNDAYRAEVGRHLRAVNLLTTQNDELLNLTVKVFIRGYMLDKHPNARAARDPGAAPSLLWNGDIVADQPEEGVIFVSERSYPVTPLLEAQLEGYSYIRVDRARGPETAWVSRAWLETFVRESFKGTR